MLEQAPQPDHRHDRVIERLGLLDVVRAEHHCDTDHEKLPLLDENRWLSLWSDYRAEATNSWAHFLLIRTARMNVPKLKGCALQQSRKTSGAFPEGRRRFAAKGS